LTRLPERLRNKNGMLEKGGDHCHSVFAFEGATDFDIVEVKVISKTDSLTKPGYKKLKLFVKIRYKIHYSDGSEQLSQTDEATFNLTVNEIYCPSCIAQVGVIKSNDDFWRVRPRPRIRTEP